MANFKAVVRKDYTSSNGKSRIYIQFSLHGRTKLLKTNTFVEPQFMNNKGKIKDSHPLAREINLFIQQEVTRCFKVVMSSESSFNSADDLLDALKRDGRPDATNFISYVTQRTQDLHSEGRYSSERAYKALVSSLKDMIGERPLPFTQIDSDFLTRFADHLKEKGCRTSTISEYVGKISVIINHAVLKKIVDPSKLPSRKITIKVDRRPIRLISVEDLRQIYSTKFSNERVQTAVDLFILSFFLNGMNPKDILYTKKSDVYRNRLLTQRLKTMEALSVMITPEAQEIISKYEGVKYMINILDKDDSNKAYLKVLSTTDYYLKIAAKEIDLKVKLSMAYARSTFATVASSKELGIPLEVIDRAQGRKIKGMTARYVQYDLDRIDEAQLKVIGLITGNKPQHGLRVLQAS
jgi:integrase